MAISINGMTKTFSNGKGIFDVSFQVKKGEVFGFLGPNGAGKSTTIRHLMGFIKPERGNCEVNNLNCWRKAAEIQRFVGYLPGEIAFFEGMTGLGFLKMIAGMRHMKDMSKRDALIEKFQFDVKTPIRKMSKGMKQKVGIVAAFMHDPDILILDEPTSGLDPLMQRLFTDLVIEEKGQGKTILLSSHSFPEIERTCDRAGMIKDGQLIAVEDVHRLQSIQRRLFEVTLKNGEDAVKLANSGLDVVKQEGLRIQIAVQGDYNQFINKISDCDIRGLDLRTQNLEDIFMHFYDRKGEES